jgi:hypothetical protein
VRREEAERVRGLDRQVDGWLRTQQVRAFAEQVERRAAATVRDPGAAGELRDWLAWVRRHADRLDPLTEAATINPEHQTDG